MVLHKFSAFYHWQFSAFTIHTFGPAVRFGVPLPSWHRVDISRQQSPSNHRHQRSSLSTLFRLNHVSHSTTEPFKTWRLCIPCGCTKSVERFALLSQICFVTVNISPGNEDLSISSEFSVTLTRPVAHHFWHWIQQVCCIFADNVKCPCNVSFVTASL